MQGIDLIITITDRDRAEDFTAWYRSQGIPLVLTALGQGTATTEILDYLGLEDSEKAVPVLCGAPVAQNGAPGGPGAVAGCARQWHLDGGPGGQYRWCYRQGISVAAAGGRGSHGRAREYPRADRGHYQSGLIPTR